MYECAQKVRYSLTEGGVYLEKTSYGSSVIKVREDHSTEAQVCIMRVLLVSAPNTN